MERLRRTWNAMGSPCELELCADDRAVAECAAAHAIADVARLEQRYSRYRDDSLLSALNRVAAAGGSVDVDAETARLLDYADACHRSSDGLFDVTSGILRRAWRFREGALPPAADVEALLAKVGWERVIWRAPRLEFREPGMELDLGGIVKEYAADRVASLCREAGVRHGMVNLGGDIAIVGPRPGGDAWRIGIRHPRRPDALCGTVALREGALASSGDYERCLVFDGVRYGHVLDPRTGWPVRHLASASVVAERCVVAGSASTIALLKESAGPSWLRGTGLWHHWVDVHGATGGSYDAANPIEESP